MAMLNKKDENKGLCAEIISVGTELLLGNILNTNTKYLSTALAGAGVNVFYETTVGDNPERLEAAIKQALKRSDVIITTGGLGPTEDDLTKEIVAKSFGLKLVLDQKALDDINLFFAKSGRIPSQNNIKQAYMPQGCKILYNKNGTAPGAIIKKNEKIAIILPGPPKEMVPMFEEYALPFLNKLTDSTIFSQTLRSFGIGESLLEEKLKMFISNENPTVALYAKTGEVHIRITAKSNSKEKAGAMCAKTAMLIKDVIGEYVYTVNDDLIEKVVIDALKDKHLKLATAESCTGGLISKKLTDVSGSSQVFDCGIVSYGNNIKADLLNVPQQILDEFGAVSKETAIAMAKGALKVSGADIAVSVTGIAGPDGGTKEKPVGLVYTSVATKEGNVFVKKTVCSYEQRDYIREQTSLNALDMVRRFIKYPYTLNSLIVEGNPFDKPKRKSITAADVFETSELIEGVAVASAISQNIIPEPIDNEDKFVVKMENPFIEETEEDLSENAENSATNDNVSSDDMLSEFLANKASDTSFIENQEQSDDITDDFDEFDEDILPWYKKVFNAVIPLKTDPKGEIIRKLVLLIAVPVFIISAVFIGKYYIDSYNNEKLIQSLQDKYVESVSVPQNEKDEIGYPSDYLDSFFELYKQNKDVIGYIKINGTAIDFPVVQYTDNDYYLRRDFNKNNSDHGIPFMDYRVDLKRPATNVLIYGHNMHDKQMFNEIINYKNLDYYKQHPTIQMDTVYEKAEWKVFAAFIANADESDGPVFQYHNFINCTSESVFNNFINEVNLRNILDTDIDVKFGDQLLTLSTCTYELNSGRFVVMARKLRPGESASVNVSNAKLNPTPLYPDKWYEKYPNAQRPNTSGTNASDYIDNSDNPTIEFPSNYPGLITSSAPTSFPDVNISQPENVHPETSDNTSHGTTSGTTDTSNELPNTSGENISGGGEITSSDNVTSVDEVTSGNNPSEQPTTSTENPVTPPEEPTEPINENQVNAE